MEHENRTFEFLKEESSKKHFAELDFAIRQGRHIQEYGKDYKIYKYVASYYEYLENYYYSLFGIYLRKENNDQVFYYFLDFGDDDKGKFTGSRSLEISDKQVIIAILLLNLYKEKFFEEKEIRWSDIENIFENSEQKQLWQTLFFKDGYKRNYSPPEHKKFKDDISKILKEFDKLGWITWIDKSEIHFEIMPSIDRIAKLYKNEITNIDTISTYINAERN